MAYKDPRKEAKYQRKYRQEHKEEHRGYARRHYQGHKEEKRAWALRRDYGMGLDDYAVLLNAQGGTCAICGMTPGENGKHLAVDHDHETGRVRGLLCHKCNLVLGNAGDNVRVLSRAITYLEESGWVSGKNSGNN